MTSPLMIALLNSFQKTQHTLPMKIGSSLEWHKPLKVWRSKLRLESVLKAQERKRRQREEERRNKEQRNYAIANNLISRNNLERGKARRLEECRRARQEVLERKEKTSNTWSLKALRFEGTNALHKTPRELRGWVVLQNDNHQRPHLSVEEKQAIRELRPSFKTQKEIAELIGTSRMEVSRVLRGIEMLSESRKKGIGRPFEAAGRSRASSVDFSFPRQQKNIVGCEGLCFEPMVLICPYRPGTSSPCMGFPKTAFKLFLPNAF